MAERLPCKQRVAGSIPVSGPKGGNVECVQCGCSFLSWPPDENNELEILASERLCRSCFERAMQEFSELKIFAEHLREEGVDPRMIDRVMLQKI